MNKNTHQPPKPLISKDDPDYLEWVIRRVSNMKHLVDELKKGAKTRRLLNPKSK